MNGNVPSAPARTNEPPPKESRFKAPTILIAISAALVILGFGLFVATDLYFDNDSAHPVFNIAITSFILSILGVLVGVLWWFIVSPGSQKNLQLPMQEEAE